MPGMLAADLYVRVFIKPHSYITRKGADLFMKKKITLLEALTGVTF
jgi:DnaJ family protein A protein 2